MEASISKTDWINNHLYLSHKFNKEINGNGVERLYDLERLSLLDILPSQLPGSELLCVLMQKNDLNFKSLG